jgi:iron complex transport system ATP-binding protein
VLHEVNLEARPGRLACLLGPNGSGKTTLLRCMLGSLRPTAGQVLLGGRPIDRHTARQAARMLAYVPQFPRMAFAFAVREVVLLGRYAHTGVMGLARPADRAVAEQALAMTEMAHLADRTFDELSGGEAQRVMIARALAQQPRVLLLDEPTSHLDVRNQLAIYRMMVRVAHDWPMAVVCVSHDVNLAGRFGDELVMLRQGRIVASGPPAEVVRPDVLRRTYDVEVELVETAQGTIVVAR